MSYYEALCVDALAWLVTSPLSAMPTVTVPEGLRAAALLAAALAGSV